MVIGNGVMAKRFSAYEQDNRVVIFASGVSDSKSTAVADYEREKELLQQTMQQYPESLLVYFSTCSIYDPFLQTDQYIIHKLNIEGLLKSSKQDYLVFRVSNVAGPGGNPKTIFHYLAQSIVAHRSFQLWKHAFRNLIDVEDVFLLASHFIEHGEKNSIVNIAHPVSFSMPEMVRTFESYFHKKGNYIEVEAGHYFHIDTSKVQTISHGAGVQLGGNYLYRLLEKYYPLV